MTVNNSYLTGLFKSTTASSSPANLFSALYPSKSSRGSSTTAATNSNATAASTYVPPTPPWNSAAPAQSKQVEDALNGQSFVNPAAAQLNVIGANASVNSDYKNLFAIYQGIQTLSALASQAAAKDNGALETAQIKSAFASGLSQITSYLQTNPFANLTLVQGAVATTQTSAVGTPQTSTNYVGANIVSGSSATEAPAFAGDVQFSGTFTKLKTVATVDPKTGATVENQVPKGTPVTVNFNLDDLGTKPRSLANVVTYLNNQLAAAGVSTRFATQRTPGAVQTATVGSQTINLSATPDQFALVVKGASNEAAAFSAPAASDAVYVAQASGPADKAAQQLLKFQTDTTSGTAAPTALARPSDTYVTSGEAWQKAPPSGVGAIKATATAPDGSVYVVANVDAATVSGQPIKGASDVALLKYDSAGKLQFTQTLGADKNASGYGIAVSADGSKIAVTGSVTGGLLPASSTGSTDTTGTTASTTTPTSFVSVFNAAGETQWTKTTASASGDQADAVTFGSDGSVYVAGQTDSAIAGGGGSEGGTDSYIQGFTASGAQKFISQYGSKGTDTPAGIAVVGNTLFVAGSESGDAVVRNYQLQASGAPVLQASRNLGSLGEGSVAGLAVNNGQIIVAGTTTNPALSAGTVTAAAGSGSNAFVAALGTDLAPSAGDSLAYYAGQGQTKATAVSVVDGQVYIAGTTGPTIVTTDPVPPTTTTDGVTSPTYASSKGYITGQAGFLAQIDPTTGAVGWSTKLNGPNGIAAPTSIAAGASGASVLDRLGLPTGTINQTPSALLTSATSVVAGDSFYVQSVNGVAPNKVTIAAGETWATLAKKIDAASNNFLKATVLPSNGQEKLTLTAAGSVNAVQLLAGPAGSDALAALGLKAGLIQPNTPTSSNPDATTKTPLVYGISLPSGLSLNSAADIAHAANQLQATAVLLKSAYQGLVNANTPTPPKAPSGSSGQVPAYLKSQLSNYQAALARLTGG